MLNKFSCVVVSMGIHYFCSVGHSARKVPGSLLSFRVIFFMVIVLA